MTTSSIQKMLILLVYYGFLFLNYVNRNAVAIECLASDQEALLDFKNGLQYSHNRLSSWRNTNYCQWQGIRCDNVTGNNENLKASCSQLLMKGWERIQVLDLSINKLHGRLPSSIGNLTYLTYLDLHDNAIEGGIPSSIDLFGVTFVLFKEGLGEAYDRDIAFANALETFGGGHNNPINVDFKGPVMTKFPIALREIRLRL
ncbi:unnamed protein product [Vicia faba]|uniref:Leucine-rich repeat-containing N-terminal plant-type domain-containing protein n=1 Tax=Vicia faba TaxID=3906 RepID=A0AAV1ARS4_VICFA|nr:unnamed protein product [Vicia faba]